MIVYSVVIAGSVVDSVLTFTDRPTYSQVEKVLKPLFSYVTSVVFLSTDREILQSDHKWDQSVIIQIWTREAHDSEDVERCCVVLYADLFESKLTAI